MKKLFLTLLMFGVTLAGWSQLTKTNWDASSGTLTLNYAGGGLPTSPEAIKDVIGRGADGAEHKVKKLVLTGILSNSEIASDAFAQLIQECPGPGENPFELDLSACTNLFCKYQGKGADGSLTYKPGNGQSLETTIHHEYELIKSDNTTYYCYSYDNPVQGLPATLDTNTEYDVTVRQNNQQVNAKFVYMNDGKWHIYFNQYETPEALVVKETIYTDVKTNQVVTVNNPDDLEYDEENDTYSYVYDESVTIYDAFAFPTKTEPNGNKIMDKVTKITFPNSDNFDMVPNGLCNAFTNLQEIVLPNKIVAVGNRAFNGCTALTTVTWSTGLVITGGESFHGSGLTAANLSTCTALEEIGYETFEECAALTSVTFPSGSTLTVLGNDAFRKSGLTSVDMSMCEGITEFAVKSSSYRQFSACPNLTEATLPPNLTVMPFSDGNQVFADCDNLTTVTFSGEAKYENGTFVNPLIIDKGAFSTLRKLKVVNFSNNLTEIRENAFKECAIEYVNLEECHELTEIQKDGFVDCLSMKEVHLCSHPKTIRTQAFHNIKSITKVEIHGCENTCMTEVVCENRGFEWDITHNQTAAPSDIMEVVAELVFPKEGSVCNDANYTSAWDYFVGDYKSGALITQENLLCYYRYVPQSGASTTKVVGYVFDEDGNQVFNADGTPKTQDYNDVPVECQYQKGNGWHEFIKVGFGEIVKPGEFLRTYSRTAGDGPCLLPKEIIAYRAIDYKSTKVGYVKDRNGDWYCVDTTQPEESRVYIQITDDTPESDYAGKTRFSKLTIGGILYLRPLIAKVAQYDGREGYTAENKDYFDSEEVYQNLTAVQGGHSYVPENTGVVLYSNLITEEAFLMLPGDFGTDVVYKQFPHTGDRYEEARRANGGPNDINMLHGSYGTGWTVAPVYPWLFKGQSDETSGAEPADETTYTAGHYSYTTPKAYRNFACTVTSTNTETGKKTYGWKRLQPSVLKVNRAFAQIPVNRFDNFNETVDQMPDFTLEDEITDDTSSNLLVINMFEYENNGAGVDGIKTVNTVENNVDNDGWYTLQGVRVLNPNKGVYIHNGQKVVIK